MQRSPNILFRNAPKTSLYVLAQTQEETIKKISKILNKCKDDDTKRHMHCIPNSVNLITQDGDVIVANAILLSMYSDYFLILFTSGTHENHNVNKSTVVPCDEISTVNMNLISEIISKGQVVVDAQHIRSFKVATMRYGIICKPISTLRYGLRRLPSYISDDYFEGNLEDVTGTIETNPDEVGQTEEYTLPSLNDENIASNSKFHDDFKFGIHCHLDNTIQPPLCKSLKLERRNKEIGWTEIHEKIELGGEMILNLQTNPNPIAIKAKYI